MAGFQGIAWAPAQLHHVLADGTTEMLAADAGTFAVSRSVHYGLFLAFEGIRFFVRERGGRPEAVFLNLDHNLERFREGIAFNLSDEQARLVPTTDAIRGLIERFLSDPSIRGFIDDMARTRAQGYLRPFTVDHAQSIGVSFPSNPVIRMVAGRYDSYLGEPFHGVALPNLVRAVGVNGTGRLKLSANYLLSVKAIQLARRIRPDAAAALFLDDRPYEPLLTRTVTEWDSSCCLIALADGTVIKIPEGPLILPSVTIQGLTRLLRADGISVEERQITYGELVDRVRDDGIVTVASVGTAGILNRCSSLLLCDGEHAPLATLTSQSDHPLFEALGRARTAYWGMYRGEADVPEGLTLEAMPLA